MYLLEEKEVKLKYIMRSVSSLRIFQNVLGVLKSLHSLLSNDRSLMSGKTFETSFLKYKAYLKQNYVALLTLYSDLFDYLSYHSVIISNFKKAIIKGKF